jgi:transposase
MPLSFPSCTGTVVKTYPFVASSEDVPPTNNASELALRWSAVFRKVTNGFRSAWGANMFAAVRSLVNTARRQGISTFDAICRAITSPQDDWLLG